MTVSFKAMVIIQTLLSTSQSESDLAIVSVTDGQKPHHTQRFLDAFILVSILLSLWLEVIMVSWCVVLYNFYGVATLHELTLGFALKKFKSEKNEFLRGEIFVKNDNWNNIIPT